MTDSAMAPELRHDIVSGNDVLLTPVRDPLAEDLALTEREDLVLLDRDGEGTPFGGPVVMRVLDVVRLEQADRLLAWPNPR